MAIVICNEDTARRQELLRKDSLTDEEQDEFVQIAERIRQEVEAKLSGLQERNAEHSIEANQIKSGKKVNKSKLYRELIVDYREAVQIAKIISELKKDLRIKI